MIRPVHGEDQAALLLLIEATGLFAPGELVDIAEMVRAFCAGTLGVDHFWIVEEDGDALVAVAYYAPEHFTEGTWNLHLIAVHPTGRRQGKAARLIRYIEQSLTQQGERLLLVETSSLPQFDGARELYQRCGFNEEARIREFYRTGEDKLTYRRVLSLSH